MTNYSDDLKTAISSDYDLFIMDELTEEQAINIAKELFKLKQKPTNDEVLNAIQKFYSGKLLSKAFESRDQARTNRLQQVVFKMIQAQKNNENQKK